MQSPLNAFGIARDDGEVGFCRLVRLGAPLFPIPQSAERDLVACGEFLLGEREGAAEGLYAQNGTQLAGPRIVQRRLRFPPWSLELGTERLALLPCRPI
jgi:hypothetical protein